MVEVSAGNIGRPALKALEGLLGHVNRRLDANVQLQGTVSPSR